MKRLAAVLLAAAIFVPSVGCKELVEEAVDETGEVIRDQKHKVVEGVQDKAIETLDAQRENAAESLSGEAKEEASGTEESY